MTSPFDSLPGGVVRLSGDLRIVFANQALGALVGRDPNDLVGEPFDVVLTAPATLLFQTHVYPALQADGRVEEVFLTVRAPDGEAVPVLLNAVRTTDLGEAAFEALVVRIRARAKWERELLDTPRALERERAASERLATDLAMAAEDLQARHAEEARNRQFRDALLGIVGHELRTPITTIVGMSHIVRQGAASMDRDTIRQHLGDIVAEADRLRRLTEDLLVLGRAEGGRLAVQPEPIVVGHLVRAVLEEERPRAPDYAFVIDDGGGSSFALGEDTYVQQIVRNFVGNAVKYSPKGTTVTVSVRREDDGVAIRVVDQGPGFGDRASDELFELFYRAPEAEQRTAGAGIGLFVCRELARAMNGRVWAAPAPPPAAHGAEFGLWLSAADERALDRG